jgi:hypothetical protein
MVQQAIEPTGITCIIAVAINAVIMLLEGL